MTKKKIKIRYLQYTNTDGKVEYEIQRKCWYGWKKIFIPWAAGMEGTMYTSVLGNDKIIALDKVLRDYYETTKDFVFIEEHPGLSIY